MLEIDRPFDGLDEVWIWSLPHPADPDQPGKLQTVTRIGTLEGSALAGRVQLLTRPSRTILGAVEEVQGLGPWRKAKLAKLHLLRSGDARYVTEARLRSGKGEASWKPRGHFQVGDHVEVNDLATGGRPLAPTVRELGESALAMGRSLLRRARDREAPRADAPEPEEVDGPVELTAFDRWLVATPEDIAGAPTWRVAIDRHPAAPDSVGLGLLLAALGLAHRV